MGRQRRVESSGGREEEEEGLSPGKRRQTLERTNLTCRICLQGILVTNSGLILTALITFSLFLRFWLKENPSLFPIRDFHFSCRDPDLSYPYSPPSEILIPDLPYEILYVMSLALPLGMVFLGEMALWTFSSLRQDKRSGKSCCRRCQTPLFIKRLLRFFANFSLGIFMTLILTDLIKIMTGMPRPYFLSICKVNLTVCHLNGGWADSFLSCNPDDTWWFREARLSFPSLHASLSAYAAIFTAIYIHEALKGHGVFILRSFLCLSLAGVSLVSGTSRLAHHKSHGIDILAGFLLGGGMAVYLAVFVLQKFGEDFEVDEELVDDEDDLLKHDEGAPESDSSAAFGNGGKLPASNSSSPDPKVFQLTSSPSFPKNGGGKFKMSSAEADSEIVLKLETINGSNGGSNGGNPAYGKTTKIVTTTQTPTTTTTTTNTNGRNESSFASTTNQNIANGVIKTGRGRSRHRLISSRLHDHVFHPNGTLPSINNNNINNNNNGDNNGIHNGEILHGDMDNNNFEGGMVENLAIASPEDSPFFARYLTAPVSDNFSSITQQQQLSQHDQQQQQQQQQQQLIQQQQQLQYSSSSANQTTSSTLASSTLPSPASVESSAPPPPPPCSSNHILLQSHPPSFALHDPNNIIIDGGGRSRTMDNRHNGATESALQLWVRQQPVGGGGGGGKSAANSPTVTERSPIHSKGSGKLKY